MTFIEKNETGFKVVTSAWDEERIIEGFEALFEKRGFGFDTRNVSCGVNASPDFGYFELGDRFWRASLCIYFSGASGCFWERGAGYPEPWLFNTRHSIELYLKGFLLFAAWFRELQDDFLSSGHRRRLDSLRGYFDKPHNLYDLYKDYQHRLEDVIARWNTKELSDRPELDKMLLSTDGEDILKEIDEADRTSFRFRYPSLKAADKEHLQELGWRYDSSQLLPKTGLPTEAGLFFDHVKVMNSIHKLKQEMKAIESYLDGCWDYLGEFQDIQLDLMREFYSE